VLSAWLGYLGGRRQAKDAIDYARHYDNLDHLVAPLYDELCQNQAYLNLESNKPTHAKYHEVKNQLFRLGVTRRNMIKNAKEHLQSLHNDYEIVLPLIREQDVRPVLRAKAPRKMLQTDPDTTELASVITKHIMFDKDWNPAAKLVAHPHLKSVFGCETDNDSSQLYKQIFDAIHDKPLVRDIRERARIARSQNKSLRSTLRTMLEDTSKNNKVLS